MFSLQWPLMLVLIPLPLLARLVLSKQDRNTAAVKVPFFDQLNRLDGQHNKTLKGPLLAALLLWAAWICLVVAAARPVWFGDLINIPQDRRDLMLAVDISESMLERDMLLENKYVDRISVVKSVVGDFVQQRQGDRMGLILFGQQAYLQTPLTHDQVTVHKQLQEALVGFAGRATAIGDTVGLAIKRLRNRPAESRVLILLTDGANTAGSDPYPAADIAAEAGIRIHTVGVGATSKIIRDAAGRQRRINLRNQIDERTLKYIADKTGGEFYRATDPESLQQIYAKLDELEPKPETQSFREQRSLLHWPVGLAILFTMLFSLINLGGRK